MSENKRQHRSSSSSSRQNAQGTRRGGKAQIDIPHDIYVAPVKTHADNVISVAKPLFEGGEEKVPWTLDNWALDNWDG
jgi:hypothetical protein